MCNLNATRTFWPNWKKKMYVGGYNTMGNSPSLVQTRGRGQPFSSIQKKASPDGGKWKTFNICLLCQKNTYLEAIGNPIKVVKVAIENFLRQLYDTDDATTFNFRTWDVDSDADIIVDHLPDLRNPNTASEFDVMVELYCEIACGGGHNDAPTADDYRVMCRLLHPQGLLLVLRPLEEFNDIVRIHKDYVCNDPVSRGSRSSVAEIIPIFSLSVDEGTEDSRSLQSLSGGLTVLQKVIR